MSRRMLLSAFAISLIALFSTVLTAQNAAKIGGTVVDVQSVGVLDATVTITNTVTGVVRTTRADASGAFSVDGLSAGTYTVTATGNGFAPYSKSGIVLGDGQTQRLAITLAISALVQQVEVNAGIDSIAAQTAPSGGFLEERSAQSLISNSYIRNFTSPIADYGSLVQIVPGAFTISSDGVGLGQSKTSFRGFPDGDFDIDFDGVPFYDTNTPTHHSWAFFPGQWIGGVDFDRSPGTASTTGPTPFGGSIHLLSMPLTSEQDLRGTFSYGTWNTKLYEGSYNSGPFGLFGGAKKSNLFVDWHRMTSDGYQTFNYNMRNAGSLLYQYQFSPKTVLTGFSGVIQLTANTYGLNPTRCSDDRFNPLLSLHGDHYDQQSQLQHGPTAVSCPTPATATTSRWSTTPTPPTGSTTNTTTTRFRPTSSTSASNPTSARVGISTSRGTPTTTTMASSSPMPLRSPKSPRPPVSLTPRCSQVQ